MFQLPFTANVSSSPILFTMMTEVICSSEMSVLTRVKQHHNPEDGILLVSQFAILHFCTSN
jgi:hypothetical protein